MPRHGAPPERSRARTAVVVGALLAVLVGGLVGGCAAGETADGAAWDEAATSSGGGATSAPASQADPAALGAPVGSDPSPVAPERPNAPADLATAAPGGGSMVGDLVDGFPIDLLPVPDDAMILVTSAVQVGAGDVQEVSLNLRTAATVEDVMTLYRDALIPQGFTEVPGSATGLAADSTFTRSGGDELVSLGVLDEDGLRTVTIGGRVRTAE